MKENPNEAWKEKIKWYFDSDHLKKVSRIDGEPMEFEWKIFPGFTTCSHLEEIQKLDERSTVRTRAVRWQNHLHVNVQQHCMGRERKCREM